MLRRLAHEPLGWRPTTLLVTIRSYRWPHCGHVWRQDISRAAEPRAKLSRRGLRWALEALVCQDLTVSRVAEGLGVSWATANTAVLDEGRQVVIDDPARFDGVRVDGVDEHAWRHTRRGDKFVTVMIDLTGVRDRTVDLLRRAARRDVVLDVAERLIAEKGYDRLTIQDLVSGTRTSKGAFYHYFATKSDVLDALMNRRLSRWEAALVPVATGPGGAACRMRALSGAKSDDRAFLADTLRTLYSDENAVVHVRTRRAAAARFTPLIVEFVGAGVASGEFTVADPTRAARVVLSLLQEGADQTGRILLAIADGSATEADFGRVVRATSAPSTRRPGAAPNSLAFLDDADLHAWAAAVTDVRGGPP